MSERPNYAEECQVDRDCRNPRLPSEPMCAVHARALAAEGERDTWRQRAEEAEELAGATTEANVRLARELLAAERTVREQREVIEAAVDAVLERSDDPGALRKAVLRYLRDRAEAAALAPDTEEGE